VHGLFANLRILLASLTLGIYYGLPWFNWGKTSGLSHRSAGTQVQPVRLDLLAAGSFLPRGHPDSLGVTVVFFHRHSWSRLVRLRLPQTVWTEVFLWIERKIDGDRMKQMKLAKLPWNREKIVKRIAKYGTWVLFSLWTGFTFVGFFTPIRELAVSVFSFALSPWEAFWVFFYVLPPLATPDSCASKFAPTCARTRASRARCSIPTR